MSNFKFELTGLDDALKALDQMQVILEQDLEKALTAASKPPLARARQLVPRPGQGGYTGGNRETHLYQALRSKIVRYPAATLLVMGAEWDKGRHGHLVEEGHDMVTHDGSIVGEVDPTPFFKPAVEETKDASQAAAISSLRASTKARIPGVT
jgi:hypothetical protein